MSAFNSRSALLLYLACFLSASCGSRQGPPPSMPAVPVTVATAVQKSIPIHIREQKYLAVVTECDQFAVFAIFEIVDVSEGQRKLAHSEARVEYLDGRRV